MKNKLNKAIPILLIAVLSFTGCTAAGTAEKTSPEESIVASASNETSLADEGSAKENPTGTSEERHASSGENSGEADAANAVSIALNGSSISASTDAVTISGSTVTIEQGGTYLLSGSLDNGSVIVNTGKEEKVQLVLNGISINSERFAPIYVVQADEVLVTLAGRTENMLTNGGTFTQIDDNNVDAVIFSKEDLTLDGTGALTVTSPAGHGIVGKDDVPVTNGNYEITTSNTAIKANDNLNIADGHFTLTAGTDGLHAENKDDESLGAIVIAGGAFHIESGDDSIHATTTLQIDGGQFTVTAAGACTRNRSTITRRCKMKKTIQWSFKRFEEKYMLTPEQQRLLLRGMKAHTKPDIYGRTTNCNIYYDTDNWELVRKSIEKPVYKEKLRVRSYGIPAPGGPVFIKIKKKYDDIVYKRRITVSSEISERYLAGQEKLSPESQIGKEIEWFQKMHRAKPKVYIAYDRTSFAGIDDPELRITFDQDIRFREYALDLRKGDLDERMLPEGTILMEIKIPETTPLWLVHLLSETAARPT